MGTPVTNTLFTPITGGSTLEVQGLTCWIPAPGKIFDPIAGEWIKVPIVKRSSDPAECYWEPDARWKKLAAWEKEEAALQAPVIKRNAELVKAGMDPHELPVHSDLNKFRKEMWQYRLGGYWFYNRGEATYLTGQNWFYLSVYNLDIGLPKFRHTDRLFFYFWEYCKEDPECFGMVEVTQRRAGKTYRASSVALEMATRMDQFKAGIQSKNDADARKVFQKAIISPYRKFPSFFRPNDNMGKTGKVPASELKFTSNTAIFEDDELESMVDFQPSGKAAYDGQKLGFYLGDEVGKTVLVDIYDRWLTVQPCLLDSSRRICGKTIHTTTVEDMESGGKPFTDMWKKSNHHERQEKKRTASGLYRFFTPAHHFGEDNRFGEVDFEKERTAILENREGLDNRAKSQDQRRYPLNEREAFQIDASKCKYDPIVLNNRRSELESINPIYEVGNLKWKDGNADTEVIFVPSSNGRFLILWHPPENRRNQKRTRGEFHHPASKEQGGGGCDPYDHTELSEGGEYTMSMGAIVIIKKPDALEPTMFDGGPVCIYAYRPDSPDELYEDALKAAHYYGVQILIETNKPGCIDHFIERGYESYAYTIPGKNKPGLAAHSQTKGGGVAGQITDVTEQFIADSLETVWFTALIDQWLQWDPAKTTKYDLAVAFGYAQMLVKKTMSAENKKRQKTPRPLNEYMSFAKRKNRSIY